MADTKPGNMVGPTDKGLTARLRKEEVYIDDNTAWNLWRESYNPDTQIYDFTWRIMVVPIVEDQVDLISGRRVVTIVGMAGFFIEYVEGDGTIIGRFIQGIASGDNTSWLFPYGNTEGPQVFKSVRLIS